MPEKKVEFYRDNDEESPHDSPQLRLPIEKNSAQEKLSVDMEALPPSKIKE